MGKKKHNKQARNTEVKAMTLDQEVDQILQLTDAEEAKAKLESIIRRYEKAAEERTAAALASNTEGYKDTATVETNEEPEEKGFKAWFKRNKVKLGIGVAIGLGALLAAALAAGSNGEDITQLEFDPEESNEDEVTFDDGLEEQEFEE